MHIRDDVVMVNDVMLNGYMGVSCINGKLGNAEWEIVYRSMELEMLHCKMNEFGWLKIIS